MAKVNRYADSAGLDDKRRYEKFLAEDEELVLVTGYGSYYLRNRFAFFIMIPGGIFLLLGMALAYFYQFNFAYGLLIGLVISAFFAFLKTVWLNLANRYLLTTRRVIIIRGLFTTKLTAILFDKITHIEVDQGFIERMVMHHGSVIVNTSGMNKSEIVLDYIDSPIEFKNLLERLINREREQYGKPSGPVTTVEGELVD
jgi:uncharacterized membrane protein YdbT with pleckstrin-like domain